MPRLPPGTDEGIGSAFSDGTLLARFEKLSKEYAGGIFRVRSPFGKRDLYVVADPDYARHVLVANSRNYEKGPAIDTVRMLLGNGLMTSEGDLWLAQRRKIQRAFQKASLATLLPTIGSCVDAMADEWCAAAAAGREVDITTATSRLALEIMVRTLFGSDVDPMIERIGHNPFHILVDIPARNLDFVRKFRALDPLIIEWIRTRAALDEDGKDLLGMVAAGDRANPPSMGERLMVDEIKTLIVAGHETTAATLNMTWYLLASHPEHLARVAAEADARRPEAMTTLAELDSLAYTKQVVREAMRLYPPGWVFTRCAIGDDTLGAYDVPAGTDVFLSPYLMHRRPDIFEDPETFDPGRFSPERDAGRHPFAYLPFSVGPRHCIGEQMAMIEMLTHVARTARRLSFAPTTFEAPELEAEVNLRMKKGVSLRPILRASTPDARVVAGGDVDPYEATARAW